MNMEFLSRNLIATTTSISVNAGTATLSNLIDRTDSAFVAQMATTTAATFTAHVTLNSNINRIILQGCNFKNFSITHSGTAFSLTNFATVASSWSSNSDTSLYLYFPTTSVATLTLIVNSNTAGTLFHSVQQYWANEKIHQVSKNPAYNNYRPVKNRREYTFELANGGWTQNVLNDFFEAALTLKYVTESEREALEDLYKMQDAVVFVPFPTGTSWDSRIFEVIWTKAFEFYKLTSNDINSTYKYEGKIALQESGH